MGTKVTFELQGGLGNQLFIYFAGLWLAKRYGKTLVLDTRLIDKGYTAHGSSLKSFKITNAIFTDESRSFRTTLARIVRVLKLKSRSHFVSSSIGYDVEMESAPIMKRYRGYFQSWLYFNELLEKDNFLEMEISEPSLWFNQTRSKLVAENPIAVHIRRGDYESLANDYGLLDVNYYKEALTEIRKKTASSQTVWIFSDDLHAASILAQELNLHKYCIVPSGPEYDAAEVMVLMSHCKWIVIANSTFSWWGAALGSSDKLVIAPQPWYKGMDEPNFLIPPNWLRLRATWLER